MKQISNTVGIAFQMSDVKNYVLLVAFHPEVNKCLIGSIPEA